MTHADWTQVFKEWYETRTKHRKLTWIYVLGQCMLSGKFSPKSIELQVSTFQAAALLLFNNDEQYVPLHKNHDNIIRLRNNRAAGVPPSRRRLFSSSTTTNSTFHYIRSTIT
eukprot:3667920-Pyramimonas_sp.AAC.1